MANNKRERWTGWLVARLILIQGVIIAIAGGLYLRQRVDGAQAAFLFLVMQAGNVAGLLWGARLQRRLRSHGEALPLGRR
jgi:hypothetical protein